MSNSNFDFVIVGSGMGGLTVGSLLAKAGHRVCVLEAHEHPGGCAHSFPMGNFTFCAAVHYIFWCGEGEPIANFLRKLDLQDEVSFVRLDSEGYDLFSCPSAGIKFSIPNGLDKWALRLVDRYPQHRQKILQFFQRITTLAQQLNGLPFRLSAANFARAVWNCPAVFQYRNWTLQKLFDRLDLPLELQALLATQVGDLGLPPDQVSLISYAALAANYGMGAYYPRNHFKQFIDAIVGVVAHSPGCRFENYAEVVEARVDGKRVVEVTTEEGRSFSGDRFIFNIDPQLFVKIVGKQHFPKPYLRRTYYDYSIGSLTIYLALKDIDLEAYGFGNWNVWHYPHLDVNRAYHDQVEKDDFSNPWLFISCPTLHSQDHKNLVCPPNHHILELVTVASYRHFQRLRSADSRAYHRLKQSISNSILETLRTHYLPELSQHMVMKVAGTPTTNERFLWAPEGNIYGATLTPRNVNFGRLKFDTPLSNVFLTGATAEFPSVGATVSGASRLYTHLTGDMVNPARDMAGVW